MRATVNWGPSSVRLYRSSRAVTRADATFGHERVDASGKSTHCHWQFPLGLRVSQCGSR